MAHVCVRCGLEPAAFWETTPWETNALAAARIQTRKEEHKMESWFTAHLMFSAGAMKRGTRIKKIIEQLNAPVEQAREMVEINSVEQMAKWEAERAKALEAMEKDKEDGRSDDTCSKV